MTRLPVPVGDRDKQAVAIGDDCPVIVRSAGADGPGDAVWAGHDTVAGTVV